MTSMTRYALVVATTAALAGCATGPNKDDPFEP